MQPLKIPLVKDKDLGNCEECGEYTDELALMGTKWICEKCIEYI